MVMRIVERDRGYRSIRERIALMKGSYTKVGVQAGGKAKDGVTDLATVAAANEFGTDRIPERSFLRSTMSEEQEKIAAIAAAEAKAILEGRKTVEQSLDLIGLYAASRVQAKIQSHPPPPNAPATIAKKGSSGTLIDSGNLMQSIRHANVIQGKK